MPDIQKILQDAETIAVMGCSDKAMRTSYQIARYLQDAGYRVVPVNPNNAKILGERCYPSLDALPEDLQIDVVNIFRRPEHTAEMVEQAIARAQTTDTKPVVWTQLGVSSAEAKGLAEEASLAYVENRCIMVEHGRVARRERSGG